MSDLLLHNGVVLTLDERDERVPATMSPTAIALQDGRVAAVGGEELLRSRRAETEVVDLCGRTVCPGFIDAHHHLSLAAWCELGINLAGCRSALEAAGRIESAARSAPGSSWLYAFNYAPRAFRAAPALDRHLLDRAAPGRAVLVMAQSFHESVLSSQGLHEAGITHASRDPFGGRIVRDRAGEPTGVLIETAVGPVEARARNSAASSGYEDWIAAMERYCRGLFASGITRVWDPGVDAMLERFLRRAQREGRLPIPVTILPVSGSGLFQEPLDRLSGPATGEYVDGLTVGTLKLFADGAGRCAVCVGVREALGGVAALAGRAVRLRRPGMLVDASAPSRPRLGRDGKLRMGVLHYPPGRLAEVCRQAHGHGFQLAVHAACNAGVDVALDAFEALPAARRRQRIEHLVSLDRRQIRRLADTGAIGVVQPAYIKGFGDEWEAMPTPTRLRSVPLRDLLDAGVPLAGSSDAPVMPYSPLAGMAAAITRRTAGGLVHQVEQAISPREALRLWTRGSALAANLDGQAGVLRPGAVADLVVLSNNPLALPASRWHELRVLRTVIAGRTVFNAG